MQKGSGMEKVIRIQKDQQKYTWFSLKDIICLNIVDFSLLLTKIGTRWVKQVHFIYIQKCKIK